MSPNTPYDALLAAGVMLAALLALSPHVAPVGVSLDGPRRRALVAVLGFASTLVGTIWQGAPWAPALLHALAAVGAALATEKAICGRDPVEPSPRDESPRSPT
jgi:hypothetical protein